MSVYCVIWGEITTTSDMAAVYTFHSDTGPLFLYCENHALCQRKQKLNNWTIHLEKIKSSVCLTSINNSGVVFLTVLTDAISTIRCRLRMRTNCGGFHWKK